MLGPALGGTRFWPYATEAEAVTDVCRLARGMTYKNAAAGLDHGGGKAVIWGDPRTDRTDDLIRAYARFVDGLAGRYLTAEDVGTTQADMDLIRTETPHVTGVSPCSAAPAIRRRPRPGACCGRSGPRPGSAGGTTTSPAGTWWSPGWARSVGALVDHLVEDGARVTVADVRPDAVAAAVHSTDRVEVVAPENAHAVECDVFAPCALGAVLSEATIPELRCEIVAGSANNQLATDEDDNRLAARDVLYVPDYVANAGGVINIAEEPAGYDHDRAWRRIEGIATTVREVIALAQRDGITPAEAADRYAEARIAAARHGNSRI